MSGQADAIEYACGYDERKMQEVFEERVFERTYLQTVCDKVSTGKEMTDYELICPVCQSPIYCEDCPAVVEMRSYSIKLDLMEDKLDEYKNEIVNLRDNMCGYGPGVLTTLTKMVDEKDSYTHDHSDRVTEYSLAIAGAMGVTGKSIQTLRRGARLHDIGKLWVSGSILKKPDKLTPEEYEEIKQHCDKGVEILKSMHFLKDVLDIVQYHHERWDGKGYPKGLVGENIPLLARIVAVADAIDAMSLKRVYRTQKSHSQILDELRREAGAQFDPDIVKITIESDVDFGEV